MNDRLNPLPPLSTELLKTIAVELRHELPGRGVDDYLEAASVVLDTIEEHNAAAAPTVLQRQAREKLAALKRSYGREIPFDVNEVFELIEQAGLALPL